MRPIMMWCTCGFGKHWLWADFVRCFRLSYEHQRDMNERPSEDEAGAEK